jgi:hypothetical protein
MAMVFVSSDERLLEAARMEHFETLNPLSIPLERLAGEPAVKAAEGN